MESIEKYLINLEKNRALTEQSDSYQINPNIDAFIKECNRIGNILRDDTLFEEERKKHSK